MDSQRRLPIAYGLLFFTPFFWAANYIVGRAAVGVVHPHMLALLRWSLALLLMLALSGRQLAQSWPRWRGEWRDMLLLGALGMWMCGAFVYTGAQQTPATNIALLYATAPVMIAAASAVWFGERLDPLQWVGVLLSLLGTLGVIAKGSPATLAALRFSHGDLWVVASVLAWTAYALLLRRRPSVLDPAARLAMITLGGVLVLIPPTLIEGALSGWPQFTPKLWELALVVALLPGFGAYQAFSYIQRELGPTKAGLMLYLGPIHAAIVAWIFLGETPQWYHLLGAALILPGMWLATRPSPRRTAEVGPGAASAR